MKNSTDTIGNRTRDLPACSAVRMRRKGSKLISYLFVCFFCLCVCLCLLHSYPFYILANDRLLSKDKETHSIMEAITDVACYKIAKLIT
jgi:hypothetical protein